MSGRCPQPIFKYDFDGERLIALPCRKRLCDVCGTRLWRPEVEARFRAGWDVPGTRYRLLTLTGPRFKHTAEQEDWNNFKVGPAWNRLRSSLSYHGSFDYFRVSEMQRRGAIHLHVLVRGLELSSDKIGELAKRAGFGFIEVSDWDEEGVEEAWEYVSKYLFDPAIQRPYYASRGWETFSDDLPGASARPSARTWGEVQIESGRSGPIVRIADETGNFQEIFGAQALLSEVIERGYAHTRLTTKSSSKDIRIEDEAPPEAQSGERGSASEQMTRVAPTYRHPASEPT